MKFSVMTFNVNFFIDGTDDLLLSETLNCVPRVADLISYSFEPSRPDEWNQELLDSNYAAAAKLGSAWEVVRVFHSIRRFNFNVLPAQSIAVYVKPYKV